MNTLFVGQNVIHLDQIDSTNSYLQQLIITSAVPEGTCVITDEQTNGRGQRGNSWLSEAGKNSTMSIVFYPKFLEIKNQFYLSKITALAIHSFVQDLLPTQKVFIKWPNDILIGDKKTAGILIENSLQNQQISNSVIGIGININQQHFTKSITAATSLSIELGKELNINTCNSTIYENLEAWYLLLKQGIFTEIDEQYTKQLFWLNQWGKFKIKEQIFEMKVVGVNPTGELLLLSPNGHLQAFNLQEVEFCR